MIVAGRIFVPWRNSCDHCGLSKFFVVNVWNGKLKHFSKTPNHLKLWQATPLKTTCNFKNENRLHPSGHNCTDHTCLSSHLDPKVWMPAGPILINHKKSVNPFLVKYFIVVWGGWDLKLYFANVRKPLIENICQFSTLVSYHCISKEPRKDHFFVNFGWQHWSLPM